jgi:CheY-like chemotaxis protein/anti-sigma regulatory factor (Ser/Thr protein kinase)
MIQQGSTPEAEPVDRYLSLRLTLEHLKASLARRASEDPDSAQSGQVADILHMLDEMMQSQKRLIRDYETDRRHVSLLVSVVSQGLRQIEQSLTGLLQVLETSTSVSPHLLAVLEGNCLSVGHLMGDLESFSEIKARDFRVRNYPFSVIGLMDEVIACFQPRSDTQCVRFSHRYAPGIPDQLIGDRGRLKQCLVTMLENAWRLTKQGDILLELDWHSGGHPSLVLRVADTGIGLSSGSVGQDAGRSGNELGMLHPTEIAAVEYGLLHEIANRVGARFDWESLPGRGTTCVLKFPVTLPAPVAPVGHAPGGMLEESAPAPVSSPDRGSMLSGSGATPRVDFCRVLIVEDDRISAMVFKRLLERMSCHATVADGGALALELIEREDYEVIFMDCVMPDMDGFETTERIRASGRSTIPIIAVTASVHPNTRSNCIRSGMNDVLSKPVDVTVLQSTIERWLGGRIQTGADRMQAINRSQEALGYSDAVFRRALERWNDSCLEWMARLREAVRAAELEAALRVCYLLRSSLSLLGIESAYSGIRQIEEYLKSGRWHSIPLLLQSLEGVILDARSRVDTWLEPSSVASGASRSDAHTLWDRSGVTNADIQAPGLVLIDPDPVVWWILQEYARSEVPLLAFETFEQARASMDPHEWERTGCVLCGEVVGSGDPLAAARLAMAHDPDLAVILIAHFPSRDLVNQALKLGVLDIVQKPLSLGHLHQTLRTAILETARRRRQREQQAATVRIGTAQKKMLGRSAGVDTGMMTRVYCLPRADAGGDFWVKLPATGHRQVYFLTDVSGHDVEAAFVSAYFHGLVRGFQESAVSGTREALEAFNRFLCHEWNKDSGSGAWVEKSVACSAIEVDRNLGTVSFHLCGSCIPIIEGVDGSLRPITSHTGVPLGWFDRCEIVSARFAISEIEAVWLWSDGIESLATQTGINPMSLAPALIARGDDDSAPDWALGASDDLLTVCMRPETASGSPLVPVFMGMYTGDQVSMIDEIQEQLSSTLRFRDPDVSDDTLYALLLCSREALLNALNHGCRGDPAQSASLSVMQSTFDQSWRIVVRDDGEPMQGSIFETHMHEDQLHRGLNLIQAFSKDLHFCGPQKTLVMNIPSQNPIDV